MHMCTSETSALDAIGAEIIRDVEPGEIISIDRMVYILISH